MKLQEIYELAIQKAMEKDPRCKAQIEKILERNKKNFEELKEEQKKDYDREQMVNPYTDTRILYGEGEREIKTILAGIDVEVGEVLLADRLKEKGQPIDLIMAHHPEGKALASLHEVMHMQEDILHSMGIPINVAEGLLAGRISEVKRGLMPLNHNKAVDAAKILDIALMCVHTPADNLVTAYLQELMEQKKPETLEDVIKILKDIPEYADGAKNNAGPTVVSGAEKSRAGKIFVDMTGGTGGSEDAFAKLSQAGVGTIVGMHIGEKHRKEAEKNHINVIIAGHIASDSLGMNLFLDEIEKQGVKILPCSGLIRVKR